AEESPVEMARCRVSLEPTEERTVVLRRDERRADRLGELRRGGTVGEPGVSVDQIDRPGFVEPSAERDECRRLRADALRFVDTAANARPGHRGQARDGNARAPRAWGRERR